MCTEACAKHLDRFSSAIRISFNNRKKAMHFSKILSVVIYRAYNFLAPSYQISFLASSVLAKASIILLFSASETEEKYIFRRNSQPSLDLAPTAYMAFITSLGRLQGKAKATKQINAGGTKMLTRGKQKAVTKLKD